MAGTPGTTARRGGRAPTTPRWPWLVAVVVGVAWTGAPPTHAAAGAPEHAAVQQVRAEGDAVLVGAGDIAECKGAFDSATAALVAATPGTVFTLGDNAYPDGTTADFAN